MKRLLVLFLSVFFTGCASVSTVDNHPLPQETPGTIQVQEALSPVEVLLQLKEEDRAESNKDFSWISLLYHTLGFLEPRKHL